MNLLKENKKILINNGVFFLSLIYKWKLIV